MSPVRRCQGCGVELSDDFGDGARHCRACLDRVIERAVSQSWEGRYGDPGAPVIGYAVWLVVGVAVVIPVVWWVAAKILAGAG